MKVSVRSYLSSGLAAATAGVIVVAPIGAQPTAQTTAPPVALAAQVQPLSSGPAALGLPTQLPGLIAQQVSFNTGVAVNFILTGAGLIGQQVQVAQRLADDIRNGTPVPVALGRAVVGFINIEVVAGHDLVGFGRQLVDFQIQFFGNLVSQLPPIIAAPAGQVLAASAGAVDTVSDLANDAIDRFAQLTPNVPFAQTQSRQRSRDAASLKPDNVVTLRRDHPKPAAALSNTGNSGRQATHALRDAVRHTLSEIGDHQQRHRSDRQQDNSGSGNLEHKKTDN
jgi:hypothetical protein